MPIVTLTDASSSAFAVPSSPSPGDVPDMFSRARRRAALRSARPILTSRTRTVAGSKPNTFCEKTKNTSTRSSPCSCNSNDLGESGRMNVRDSPRAVRYVPAKSSTFSPLSPHRMAKKLRARAQPVPEREKRTEMEARTSSSLSPPPSPRRRPWSQAASRTPTSAAAGAAASARSPTAPTVGPPCAASMARRPTAAPARS